MLMARMERARLMALRRRSRVSGTLWVQCRKVNVIKWMLMAEERET